MKQNIQSPTSRFLFDRLQRSIDNNLTLSEKFIFSFLSDQNIFEKTFHILYSGFQLNLLQNPETFFHWIPDDISDYPTNLEYILLLNIEYENIQKAFKDIENENTFNLNQIQKENQTLQQENQKLQIQLTQFE
jgi:hypothetical protein